MTVTYFKAKSPTELVDLVNGFIDANGGCIMGMTYDTYYDEHVAFIQYTKFDEDAPF